MTGLAEHLLLPEVRPFAIAAMMIVIVGGVVGSPEWSDSHCTHAAHHEPSLRVAFAAQTSGSTYSPAAASVATR